MDDFIAVVGFLLVWGGLWFVLVGKMGFRGKMKWGLIIGMCIPGPNAIAFLLMAILSWPNNQQLKAANKELSEHRKTAATQADLDAELRRLQDGG